MQDHAARILDRVQLGQGWLVRVHYQDAHRTCGPGQFLLLRCGSDWTPYLRKPLFPSSIQDHLLTFWGNPVLDPAIMWMLDQADGTALDFLGPLGNGYVVHRQQGRLLLVAQWPYLAPVLSLVEPQLAQQGSVGLLLEAPRTEDLLPPSALPPAVEYYTATADSSVGHAGPLTDLLLQALPWADLVCAAGSLDFIRGLKRLIGDVRLGMRAGFAQVLAPVPLACGVGACLACLVDSGRGWHRACKRGPVFDLAELAL